MSKHTIQPADFYDHTINQELAGSYGKGSHKSLRFVSDLVSTWYEVYNNREKILETDKLQTAIDKYNELP